MCESVSFFDGFGFKENFIPDNKVRVLKTYELKNLFFVKQLRHKWIETRVSRIHTNWISRIRDSSWNSCRAFVLQRREQIRPQSPLLFAHSAQILALQQKSKKTLRKILRFLRPS